RKAGRDDIKQHPAIASTYKEYTKLRDILSRKATSQHSSSPHPQSKSQPAIKKRKFSHHHAEPSQTPRKAPRHDSTPSKPTPLHPSHLDPYDSPSAIRKLFTPSHLRTSIGPTPQKDGKVLGLFDSLPDPSPIASRTTRGAVLPKAQNTPSKPRPNSDEQYLSDSLKRKHSRTPTSTGKRFLLDTYATPTARRILNPITATPSSVSKLHFSTPSFLRRDSQRIRPTNPQRGEDSTVTSPVVAVRMPAKPPVRGLSSMLAGLRRMEDERLDEEMEVLRDLEMERSVPGRTLVRDSQAIIMPLGADRGSDDDHDDNDNDNDNNNNNNKNDDNDPEAKKIKQLKTDGKAPKTWKKKGQKRTTRRVVMKPSRSKPKPEPVWLADRDGDSASSNDDGVGVAVVMETQVNSGIGNEHTAHEDHHAEHNNNDAVSSTCNNIDASHTPPTKPPKTTTTTTTPSSTATTTTIITPPTAATTVNKKDTVVKKAVRKISATAHANYTRLKLRHKNSKGKGGGGRGGGRFGRR
ncbi:MAG: DNA replication regulator sld2, partial [Pleopsidium flavum]